MRRLYQTLVPLPIGNDLSIGNLTARGSYTPFEGLDKVHAFSSQTRSPPKPNAAPLCMSRYSRRWLYQRFQLSLPRATSSLLRSQ
jgi:hypothetical protein